MLDLSFFWGLFLCLPIVCGTFLVSLCFLHWSVLSRWVYGMNFYGRMPVGFSGAVSLISWALWFWAVIYVGSLYVFGFWLLLGLYLVGPSLELVNWGSLHQPCLVFCCGICVKADSAVCTRFWGFSLTLVHVFVLSNFSTILLYFQMSPGLWLVWLPFPPSPSSFVICWWVSSSSRCTGLHHSHLTSSLE